MATATSRSGGPVTVPMKLWVQSPRFSGQTFRDNRVRDIIHTGWIIAGSPLSPSQLTPGPATLFQSKAIIVQRKSSVLFRKAHRVHRGTEGLGMFIPLLQGLMDLYFYNGKILGSRSSHTEISTPSLRIMVMAKKISGTYMCIDEY